MAVYLELARTILEERPENAIIRAQPDVAHLLSDENRRPDIARFLLNEKQCTHLWHIIRMVYNYLASSQLPDNKRHKYLPNIFKEFCIVVTRANAIVQIFSSEQSWLRAAIFQGNHRLAFQESIVDLQACVRLFHESTGHRIPAHAAATIWRQDYLDALMDAADLRKNLEDLLARPALGDEERLLAQYLLDRERSLSRCNGLDECIPQFYRVKWAYPASEQCIGRGSFGAVSEVRWLGMACAKKHFHGPTDETSVTEFMREVSVLARLNHPHIVKLLCTSEQPDDASFVMELMPMSLSGFIGKRWRENSSEIVPAAAIDMMLQIARGMEYLHGQDIVHRDLKSSNILVAPSRVKQLCDEGYADVKLIDFGLAKVKVHDLTNPTREMMGTSKWRAPEAFGKGDPIDWKKADAYSFAMICSEILTGETPFKFGPLSELYTRITGGERPKLPPSCPDALASLLEDCWNTSPCFRPSFTRIRQVLISVKCDLLKLRWDGYERAPVAQMSESGFRSLLNIVTSPEELRPLLMPRLTSPSLEGRGY